MGNSNTVARDISHSIEILANLIYLTKLAADEPETVRRYMLEADKALKRLAFAIDGAAFT